MAIAAKESKVTELKPEQPANYFAELAGINVGEHIERKGQFSYLSWAWAVAELRKRHPDAAWEVLRFDCVPYMKTELGYFVEVAVTVKGVTLSQIHPVLNARNQPIQKPSPFDINTSIQRCLVKAIALHGLGLYIYAGEDLPDVDAPQNPGYVTENQLEEIAELAMEVGANIPNFCKYMKVNDLSEIKVTDYDKAVKGLESKRKKQQQGADNGTAATH